MRNPLSAILQCSDEITTSLSQITVGDEKSKISTKLAQVLESSIDAAQTIALCAQHQVGSIRPLFLAFAHKKSS